MESKIQRCVEMGPHAPSDCPDLKYEGWHNMLSEKKWDELAKGLDKKKPLNDDAYINDILNKKE